MIVGVGRPGGVEKPRTVHVLQYKRYLLSYTVPFLHLSLNQQYLYISIPYHTFYHIMTDNNTYRSILLNSHIYARLCNSLVYKPTISLWCVTTLFAYTFSLVHENISTRELSRVTIRLFSTLDRARKIKLVYAPRLSAISLVGTVAWGELGALGFIFELAINEIVRNNSKAHAWMRR